jgi:hypothetical protein
MRVGLHAKCLLLSSYKQNWNVSTNSGKIPETSNFMFLKLLHIDGQDEANGPKT